MPFSTVAELRSSKLFKRMTILQKMGVEQLRRFAGVFNTVFERVLRQGGTEEEAESTALPIALSAARNAAVQARSAALEDEEHFFVPMMPEMMGAGPDGTIDGRVFDMSFVRENIELVSAAVEGNEFNTEHDRGAGFGVIRRLIHPRNAPDDIRERADKDTPFIAVASFYEDAPDEVRSITSISPEWDEFNLASGEVMPIPTTFALTETPLNGVVTGIKKVASTNARANLYKEGESKSSSGTNMPGEDGNVEETEQFDALKASLDEATEKIAELKEASTSFDALKAGLAALVGKPEDVKDFDAEAAVAALGERLSDAQAKIDEMAEIAATQEAASFAAGLVDEGKIASDATDTWTELYLKDPDAAKSVAATLRATGVPTGASQVVIPPSALVEEADSIFAAIVKAGGGL